MLVGEETIELLVGLQNRRDKLFLTLSLSIRFPMETSFISCSKF